MFIARIASTLIIATLLSTAASANPSQRTTDAFGQYLAQAEARIAQQRTSPGTFLTLGSRSDGDRAAILDRLRRGEVVINKRIGIPKVPDGLIHDWVGAVFVPSATLDEVMAVVQDYDHLVPNFSPDVVRSKVISRSGDDFEVFMRLRKHKAITVILDTEYGVHYGRLDPAHVYSISRSTRVNEISDPGTPGEHIEARDHGFMWRLNSYWAFEQTGEGVLVECEAISLTRDIPTGLGWLIGPIVQSIPRESLQFTLGATRQAVSRVAKNVSQ